MRIPSFVSPGGLLALATIAALALANGPWSEAYFSSLAAYVGGLSLQHWVNDGLMAVFFFVVGMEIKKELVVGELADPKRAALPIAAALGGMVGPALLYLAFNPGGPAARGWGIPMATDIAFALAVLQLFGRRVPAPLKVFLLALAIVDDLGAVLVIAFFYTSQINGPYLGFAALGLGAMVLLRRAGVGRLLPYVLLGALVWFAVLRSGVHATIAGVLVGLLTPIEHSGRAPWHPLDWLVHQLHPYVNWLIMPIFALANAGVRIEGGAGLAAHPVFLGVALGLLVGKPAGILLFAWLAAKLRLAHIPRGVGWSALAGVACLGGVGFTMALFVSSLALAPEQELFSKSGILAGSAAAALLGAAWLACALPKSAKEKAPGR